MSANDETPGAGTGPDASPSETEPVPVPVPRVANAAPKRGGFVRRLVTRLRQPLPGAQPRIRFEIPPELVAERATLGAGKDTPSDAPRTRLLSQHPIYMGFMGTVGAGIAIGLYSMFTNIQQLLVWILTAMFIALGLDPVVRWLETRKIPRPAGILISLTVLVLASLQHSSPR